MKFKILLMLVVVSSSVFASGTKGDHKEHTKEKITKLKRISLVDKEKYEVISMLEVNEGLHSSFFKYNGKVIEENARKLSESIKKISNQEISKLLKFSLTKVLEIKSENEREINNQNYHLVSMALIHIVNKYDVGSKYNAYSCPMVKKKWLQNSKKMAKVHNPYAPDMPHCGSMDTHHD